MKASLENYRGVLRQRLSEDERIWIGMKISLENYRGVLRQRLSEDEKELTIYPNPANETITISYEMDRDSKLDIRDVTGRMIKSLTLSKEVNKIQVEILSLSSGVYFYEQKCDSKIIKSGKLIKGK